MKTIKPLTTALALLICSASYAASDNIDMSHHVDANVNNGLYQSISLTLTINNSGLDDLHSVKIYPSGDEFAASERENIINVGYLPAMGQSVIHITANTAMAEAYFRSAMPVFFMLNAKTPGGTDIELPLHSLGEGL